MNIIEQYIEMNNEVLSKLTRENPTLGEGIIDTLAVLSNYIKDNLFNLEDSGELSDVLAVFENGLKVNTIRPKRIPIFYLEWWDYLKKSLYQVT